MRLTKRVTAAALLSLSICSGAAFAGPQELSLIQLDRITAGNASDPASVASGGAIIAGGSTGSISASGAVNVGDGVQANARALNLVNSSESTVANGVNIFDGRADAAATFAAGTNFEVNQLNEITQDQRRAASLPSYERSENNVTVSTSNTGQTSSTALLNTVDSVTDVDTLTTAMNNTTSGSVDAVSTILGQKIQAGKGISAAGSIDVDFEAGNIEFLADAAGGVSLGGAGNEILTGQASLELRITLPRFTVAIEGAGCGVMNGSCTATGSNTETFDSKTDKSTLYTVDSQEFLDNTWEIVEHSDVRGPLSIYGVNAEYIVVDESNITVDSDYIVTLAGGAQADLRAMNVVNAAGSAVANGVNVAQQRTGNLQVGGGPLLNLTQTNVIVHSR